ncbi:glycosyltransferase family 25 protein [Melaminivora alkalimesophila]|uniref:Glycosyl transferase family 25 n=1 Tax=Melaminivora alkalimesophila TaxID=1165852 RepID=A0A317RCS6_9BURK|nr:glycosyltransferase family 25 protein [Melaminivora alkalimesophila]PWW47039.1 glycosyl transferase family 25 [Melaminivora alkalimesophila]
MRLPIVFINLDRDAERRTRLLAELQQIDMPSERFPAVWWADVPPEQASRWYSDDLNARQYYKPLRNGEKGCYASHIGAWQQLLASGAPALVVLEDDVRLTPQFADVVNAIAALQEPWDMVKLRGRDREKVRSQRPLVPGSALVDYSRVPSMTAGYVVSRAGAAKLLAHRQPFGRPIDVDLRFWWECDQLRILGVSPSAIALDDTSEVSSIWDTRDTLTPGQRWRKFTMKLALTLGNAWHRRSLPKL